MWHRVFKFRSIFKFIDAQMMQCILTLMNHGWYSLHSTSQIHGFVRNSGTRTFHHLHIIQWPFSVVRLIFREIQHHLMLVPNIMTWPFDYSMYMCTYTYTIYIYMPCLIPILIGKLPWRPGRTLTSFKPPIQRTLRAIHGCGIQLP